MIIIEIMVVFLSLVLLARFVINIEEAATIISKIIFLAISGSVVFGLSINVIPSTMRKKAMTNPFRMIISILLEIFSTFLMVLSKSNFLVFFCFTYIYFIICYAFCEITVKNSAFGTMCYLARWYSKQ